MGKCRCNNGSKGNVIRIAALLFVAAIAICFLSLFSRRHTPSQTFVFAIYGAVALSDVYLTKLSYDKTHNYKEIGLLFLASLGVAVLLEGLTVLGSPAGHFRVLSDWSKKRILFFALAAITTFLVIHLRQGAVVSKDKNELKASNRINRKVAFIGLILAVCVVVSFGIGTEIPFIYVACILLAVIALLISCYMGHLSLPLTFFFVSFLVGSLFIYGTPVTTGLSWDDQIHYTNALDVSYLFESQLTNTDVGFSDEAYLRAAGDDAPELASFDSADIKSHRRELDASYCDDVRSGNVQVDKSVEAVYTISSVGYLPSAFGLWLGRLVHMGFSERVCFAKMMNLLSYCGVVAMAIAIAPSKKSLFAFVGLLPTALFLASNFSYDAWLNSFVMLGFAYYLRYAWGPQDDFTLLNIAMSFLYLFLGLAVKAVYFPIIGLLFLVPKRRFSDDAQRKRYYFAVVSFGVFTFASFALPYLFTAQGDSGDIRGGSDVNPMGQILFILENPLRYARILLSFFSLKFLSPANSIEYGLNFAYLGSLGAMLTQTWAHSIAGYSLSALLVLNGVSSRDDTSVKHASVGWSLWALFLFVITCVMVATALYVSFTPVGLDTVNGCQFRYIIALLVPCLSVALNVRGHVFAMRRKLDVVWLLIGLALCFICLGLLVFPRLF